MIHFKDGTVTPAIKTLVKNITRAYMLRRKLVGQPDHIGEPEWFWDFTLMAMCRQTGVDIAKLWAGHARSRKRLNAFRAKGRISANGCDSLLDLGLREAVDAYVVTPRGQAEKARVEAEIKAYNERRRQAAEQKPVEG